MHSVLSEDNNVPLIALLQMVQNEATSQSSQGSAFGHPSKFGTNLVWRSHYLSTT
jgi:hypothetical protein